MRVSCFVDGFNLYHAIDELCRPRGKHDLKWCNLHSLANAFLKPGSEQLTGIHYFSAHAHWLPDAMVRHQAYVEALRHHGVTIHLGHFKTKKRRCKSCSAQWDGHEEKESDVSLAVQLLHQAWLNTYDKAIIMTADTDIVPVLRLIREQFPDKQLMAAIPAQRYGNAILLREICHHQVRIKVHHFENNLLPEKILDHGGNPIVTRPAKYTL